MKKFTVAIGNPPYMETQKNTSDDPVYDKFMDAAFEIAEKVELITPGRFLFNAGKTKKAWNEKMLNDEHFKVLKYEADASSVFPNTQITGGVAISYRDSKKTFGAIENFTSFDELNSILRKVKINDFIPLFDIIVSSFAYHYTDKMHDDYPGLRYHEVNGENVGVLSKGHDYDLKSNAFDRLPQVFHKEKPNDGCKYIQIFGRADNERAFRYIKREYINDVVNLDKYKVMLAKAYGCPAIGEGESTPVISQPIVCGPGIGTTESFISIGAFDTKEEADNCYKYLLTRFARTMLGILKITQDMTPTKWKFVPLQNFTSNSDINWNTSIANIDKQLYKKYNLTDEEIDFIETHVKEME